MSLDRTEKPTAKRLRDARRRGQVARSRDLAMVAATAAVVIAMGQLGAGLVQELCDQLSRDLAQLDETGLQTLAAGDVTRVVFERVAQLFWVVGPIGLCTAVVGVAAQCLQGGWAFSPEALTFDWSRLNPATGIKRFAFSRSGVDTLKTLVAVALVSWLSWRVVEELLVQAVSLAWMRPAAAAAVAWNHIQSLLWRAAIALGTWALVDYGLQHYRLMSVLKMTKQEVRDEMRQTEGSAEVKGRVRRIQREMARRRMIADVARATVVITNPTHYAVALEYRRATMAAPVVLAKGADFIALAIYNKAREHGVPIVEHKPLAQALFRTAEVGATIPGPLFNAVAEVLAQLIRLKQLTL